MVGASLVLAKESAIVPVDLDALVREGKRLYISKVVGMTEEDIHTFEYSFESAVWSKIATLKREQGERGMTEENIRAFDFFIRAAEAGHSKAQFLVAELCYWFGAGVPLDYVEAAKWYRKAAEQGDATAQFALATCYQFGEGVPQDSVEAAKLYRLAADQGNWEAKLLLGESKD